MYFNISDVVGVSYHAHIFNHEYTHATYAACIEIVSSDFTGISKIIRVLFYMDEGVAGLCD